MDNEVVFEKRGVRIVKVAKRVYFRCADWEQKEQCNSGYIVLPGGVAVIDASTAAGAPELIAEAKELFGKPIKYVILTHAHWDHADGLPELVRNGADTLIASSGAAEALKKSGAALPEFIIRVSGKQRFDMGGTVLEAFTLKGAAHSSGDLFISFPAAGILFTGDAAAEQAYLYFKDCDIANWLRALDSLGSMRYSKICVGHGSIKDNLYFAAQRKYILAVADAAWTQMSKCDKCNQSEGAYNCPDGSPDCSGYDGEKAAAAALADPENLGAAAALQMNKRDIVLSHIAQVFELPKLLKL